MSIYKPSPNRQSGVSLIEVMIAVLVFSIGLIGLAGLLVFATQSSHDAYLRTQVTFLADAMADRMRANNAGVWNNNYNSSAYPISSTVPACAAPSGCIPAQVAQRDQIMWSNMLTAFLPNPQATINCSRAGLSYWPDASDIQKRPPYGGTCTMTITWNERGVTGNQTVQPQTFAWVFQP